MSNLQLKKSLGQHFLTDENVIVKIAEAIGDLTQFETVVEIGPGMGALTKHLLKLNHPNFFVVELDNRWAEYLNKAFPALKNKIINEDFLKVDLSHLLEPVYVIGNFPYNISSQIVFRIIDEKEKIERMTGMFQKEVALRIAAAPGSKDYGVISVLTQAFYDAEYLFDVPPESFEPPPKVMSGVIRLNRKKDDVIDCDEKAFKRVVKTAFTQRRKTLRNSLKPLLNNNIDTTEGILNLRPEQLSVAEFVWLTKKIYH